MVKPSGIVQRCSYSGMRYMYVFFGLGREIIGIGRLGRLGKQKCFPRDCGS